MEKKGVSLQSRFMAELSRANFPMMVGFALCQVWLSLCFFAPQLFPENSSVSVYEISLVACVVSLVPALASPKASEAWLERPWSVRAVALCASVGTLAIPFSAGSTGLDGALQVFAGLLTGIASGWLFVGWYQAFCKLGDLIGFVLGVVANNLFMYVLTAVASLPEVSPWIMVAVACALPLLSALLLNRRPETADFVGEPTLPPRRSQPRRVLALLCTSIFFVSFVDEFMRNYYLEGTDLAFYSGSLNLVLLVAKVACSTVLVVIIADRSRKMSLVYRISFLLTMAAVLLMPYGGHCPDVMYGIASFGAFLFKIMIMILAFNFCQRYRTSPLLVYALTRITFSLDLLLGFGGFNVYRMLAPAVPDLLGLISVALGLLVVAIYSFVFTDRSYAPSFVAADGPAPSGETVEERCDRLVRVGSLSRRESDVLRLVAKGRSAPRICEELHLAMNTVNTHTSHIYQKLKIHSRQELLDLLENMAPEEERPSVGGRS